MELQIVDAGVMEYRAAWDMQLQLHARVMDHEFAAGVVMLVEHPPVVTIGRHPGSAAHLLASADLLQARGVAVVETDRGGDITFHGPGQLVAYPIIPLNKYGLNLHTYMRFLEQVVIELLQRHGIAGQRNTGATGVWVQRPDSLVKVCAMGVKLRRWVTLHGLALNVTTDLSFFDLINPCGLGLPVTSMEKLLGKAPAMADVKQMIGQQFTKNLAKAGPIDP